MGSSTRRGDQVDTALLTIVVSTLGERKGIGTGIDMVGCCNGRSWLLRRLEHGKNQKRNQQGRVHIKDENSGSGGPQNATKRVLRSGITVHFEKIVKKNLKKITENPKYWKMYFVCKSN